MFSHQLKVNITVVVFNLQLSLTFIKIIRIKVAKFLDLLSHADVKAKFTEILSENVITLLDGKISTIISVVTQKLNNL